MSALAKVLASAIEAKLKKSTLTREQLLASAASAAGANVDVMNDICDGQLCPSRSELAALATVLDADALALVRAAKADGCSAGEGDVEAAERTRRRSSGVQRYRLALAKQLGLPELKGDFAQELLDYLGRQTLSERAHLCRALGVEAGTAPEAMAVRMIALVEGDRDDAAAARHVDPRQELALMAERYASKHGCALGEAVVRVAAEQPRLAREAINAGGYAGPLELLERGSAIDVDPRQELADLATKRARTKGLDLMLALSEVSAENQELVERVRARYGPEASR